jgi:hypothetical protein
MWVYENLELCISGVFVAGIAGHFFYRWRHRQRYRALRRAFEEAVRQVQATDGDAAAVVRCAELERDFMRAWWLPYSLGLGRRIWRMLKLCALLTFFAFICLGGIAARERRRTEAGARGTRAAVDGSRAPPRAAPRR